MRALIKTLVLRTFVDFSFFFYPCFSILDTRHELSIDGPLTVTP